MFSFESFLDLPLIWLGLIGTAIFLYVLLDGFDLGIGVLFPFAPTDQCRDRMMNSIAPFWDANETWLVLGGGGAKGLAHVRVMKWLEENRVPVDFVDSEEVLLKGLAGYKAVILPVPLALDEKYFDVIGYHLHKQ